MYKIHNNYNHHRNNNLYLQLLNNQKKLERIIKHKLKLF